VVHSITRTPAVHAYVKKWVVVHSITLTPAVHLQTSMVNPTRFERLLIASSGILILGMNVYYHISRRMPRLGKQLLFLLEFLCYWVQAY
jgi:hypothetical protein